MPTSNRQFHVKSFESLVQGCYFAQIHNKPRTRVVHETGLYSSRKFAEAAARDWALHSSSKMAKSLADG